MSLILYCVHVCWMMQIMQQISFQQQQNIKGRRKLDIEDIRLTAESLLTELFYTNTTPTIPFFIRSSGKKLQLQTICVNIINKPMIQCFKNSNDCFDFTNLSTPLRIQRLVEIVQDDGQRDPLLAVYLDKSGSPKVMFDYLSLQCPMKVVGGCLHLNDRHSCLLRCGFLLCRLCQSGPQYQDGKSRKHGSKKSHYPTS